MIVVGLVIGMGIFRTAATSAKDAIAPSVYFSAWIVGGIVAMCGALTYAEIGSRYPVTGGYYKVFSYAYHPSIAFAINCIILGTITGSFGGVLRDILVNEMKALRRDMNAGKIGVYMDNDKVTSNVMTTAERSTRNNFALT